MVRQEGIRCLQNEAAGWDLLSKKWKVQATFCLGSQSGETLLTGMLDYVCTLCNLVTIMHVSFSTSLGSWRLDLWNWQVCVSFNHCAQHLCCTNNPICFAISLNFLLISISKDNLWYFEAIWCCWRDKRHRYWKAKSWESVRKGESADTHWRKELLDSLLSFAISGFVAFAILVRI